jgi:hypothetical protein
MQGQLVCSAHGGRTPQGRAAGQRRLGEAKVHKALIAAVGDAEPLASLGDVYDELLAVAGVAKAWREILQARVAKLSQLGETTLYAGTQLAADVILFERALDRSAKIAEAVARLDVDERKQALDERIAGQLVGVLRLILGDLRLSDEQAMVAELVVPKRLREAVCGRKDDGTAQTSGCDRRAIAGVGYKDA